MVCLEPQEVLHFAPIPSSTREKFDPYPWTAPYFTSPSLAPFITRSRVPKTHTTEDNFVSKTLNSPSTVPAWQAFYTTSPQQLADAKAIAEMNVLLVLGHGVDGHPSIAHGGYISALFDEAITLLAFYHRKVELTGYSAFLKTEFKKPVKTPGCYRCRSVLEDRSQGRKVWLRVELLDGEGTVLAKGDGLVVEVEREKPRGKL